MYLVVGVFDTADDAHVHFLASNELSLAYGAKFGFVVRGDSVDGLGDEAWRLWAHGNGRQVTYHWRRENLVTEVHVHCYDDCGPRRGFQCGRRSPGVGGGDRRGGADLARLAPPSGQTGIVRLSISLG